LLFDPAQVERVASAGTRRLTIRFGLESLGGAWNRESASSRSVSATYPGAEAMTLKLLFDPETGKVLGAQAVGGAGVDKRIDVLAVAIQAGMGAAAAGSLSS